MAKQQTIVVSEDCYNQMLKALEQVDFNKILATGNPARDKTNADLNSWAAQAIAATVEQFHPSCPKIHVNMEGNTQFVKGPAK